MRLAKCLRRITALLASCCVAYAALVYVFPVNVQLVARVAGCNGELNRAHAHACAQLRTHPRFFLVDLADNGTPGRGRIVRPDAKRRLLLRVRPGRYTL